MTAGELSRRVGALVGSRLVTLDERELIADAVDLAESWADLPADVRSLLDRIADRPGRGAPASGSRHLSGKHDQSTHGHGHGKTGQAALDEVPAKLTPAPGGHGGNYEGSSLAGPAGMGERQALDEYEGVEYQVTNSYLRNPGNLKDPDRRAVMDHRVTEIDKTMAVSKLKDDVQVDRVIQDGASVFGDAWHGHVINWKGSLDEQDAGYERWLAGERPNLTGARFKEKGYLSTTADAKVAEKFGQRWAQFHAEHATVTGEPVIMTIKAPKGTGAVQLSPMWSGKSSDPGAAEILLQRGLTLQVVADHGLQDGFRRLLVEVVPGD
jgi:ADP-ribosyltransferase exoenzyme